MKIFLVLLLFAGFAKISFGQNIDVQKEFDFAKKQTSMMLKEISIAAHKPEEISPRTIENDELKLVRSNDWTSGFFPGVLWYLYEYTGEKKWMKEAVSFTEKLDKEQFNTRTHDLGFMIYCSYGNGYRLTKNENYKNVIIQAAKSLATRFNAKVGVIRSWDHNTDKWKYPVIIDNMMNLEMLFEATRITGDSVYYKIAVSHADKTLLNHFRADYSSFHVVDYDVENGSVTKRGTHQGYNDASSWARGQAWALYGYTMCYRETKNPIYLLQAEKIAEFMLNHIKYTGENVPFWDYNDPQIPNAPRDASAAAVTASALYELGELSKNETDYIKVADNILKSLALKYTSKSGTNKGFILAHSTGNKPADSEVDVPLNYADYYYLEALLRSKKVK